MTVSRRTRRAARFNALAYHIPHGLSRRSDHSEDREGGAKDFRTNSVPSNRLLQAIEWPLRIMKWRAAWRASKTPSALVSQQWRRESGGRTNKQVGNALGASERTRPTASGDAFWLDAALDRIHGISDTLNGRFWSQDDQLQSINPSLASRSTSAPLRFAFLVLVSALFVFAARVAAASISKSSACARRR